MKKDFCLLIIIWLMACCQSKPAKQTLGEDEHTTGSGIIIQVYQRGSKGFGYRISQSGKDIIDQPTIPAIPQNKTFASKEDALHTAQLVQQKLMQAVFPPAISILELDSMHIKY